MQERWYIKEAKENQDKDWTTRRGLCKEIGEHIRCQYGKDLSSDVLNMICFTEEVRNYSFDRKPLHNEHIGDLLLVQLLGKWHGNIFLSGTKLF